MEFRAKVTFIFTIAVILVSSGSLLIGQESSAEPPIKCAPWPECKNNDGGTGGGGGGKNSFDFQVW